jgi:O-antigen/teichoic acid export membrane protein
MSIDTRPCTRKSSQPIDSNAENELVCVCDSQTQGKTRMSFWATSSYAKFTHSRFLQNVIWSTSLSGAERIIAVIQTVLIARTLGMTEYGVYGFLFGTIGFVASIVGLQMGLTATVFIARYRETEKAKAALIIQYVMRFALLVSLLFALLILPCATRISSWFLATDQYAVAVIIGCLFVGATVLSGVQDGVLQGFEDFRSIAEVRILTSMLTLVGIYPAAKFYGLDGVMFVLLSGVAVQFALLHLVVVRHKNTNGIPRKGAGLRFTDVIFRFSLPSLMVSLLVGAVTWFGTFLLSRQPDGFKSLAIVNTGLQWRGPILLLASSIGSVAIPTFSRYAEQRNDAASNHLQRKLLWLNGAIAIGISAALVLVSRSLLMIYGNDFSTGQIAFAILVVTTVPQVLANVYMQNLVGAGKLWRQLYLHFFLLIPMGLMFMVFIPLYQDAGYAIAMAIGVSVFAISIGSIHRLTKNKYEKYKIC